MIKSRRVIRTSHVAHIWKDWSSCRVSVGKSLGKRPFGRTKHGREDASSTEVDVGEI